MALDQQVLGYFLTTMTREFMAQVATAQTSAQLWSIVDEIFSSQTRDRSVNTRIVLATTKKGAMSANEYLTKMKMLADEMAAAAKPLGVDEFTSYVITGLDEEYNPRVSALLARVEPDYSELVSHIVSFEGKLEMQRGGNGGGSSVNSASGRSNTHGGDHSGQRPKSGGRGHGSGSSSGGRGTSGSGQKPCYNGRCQVCFKEGHNAVNCWHRFDQTTFPMRGT